MPRYDGQIEAGPFFLHVGGREVDGGAAEGEGVAGIDERRHDAVARFFDRGVGQADDDDESITESGIDLDLDGVGFDAVHGGGTDFG